METIFFSPPLKKSIPLSIFFVIKKREKLKFFILILQAPVALIRDNTVGLRMQNEGENEAVNKTTLKRGRDGWGGDLCRYDG